MAYKPVEELDPLYDYIIINNCTSMVVCVTLMEHGVVEVGSYDKRAKKHHTYYYPRGVQLKLDPRKDLQ